MSMSEQTATFTIQELAPDVAKVFEAARRFGSAMVRTSGGETFEVTKKQASKPTAEELLAKHEAHAKRLKELGLVQPTADENERINRIIAGEI